MPRLTRTVQGVHFEDFSGVQFERLVFAYLLRTKGWQKLDWYGEAGADLGRDIWGMLGEGSDTTSVCVQCANRQRLAFAKVRGDLDKIVSGPKGKPDRLILVASGRLSAQMRQRICDHASKQGLRDCELWSGSEFEERLRANCESLLKRFVEGVEFPDSTQELRALVEGLEPASDQEILALMAELFDRPAFYTPFYGESSLGDFKKAIGDTIEALNTGVHRLRDGTQIRRIPSRHKLQGKAEREALANIVDMLVGLRATFEHLLRSGHISPCGSVDPYAADVMDAIRGQVLTAFHLVYPPFDLGRAQRALRGSAFFRFRYPPIHGTAKDTDP